MDWSQNDERAKKIIEMANHIAVIAGRYKASNRVREVIAMQAHEKEMSSLLDQLSELVGVTR